MANRVCLISEAGGWGTCGNVGVVGEVLGGSCPAGINMLNLGKYHFLWLSEFQKNMFQLDIMSAKFKKQFVVRTYHPLHLQLPGTQHTCIILASFCNHSNQDKPKRNTAEQRRRSRSGSLYTVYFSGLSFTRAFSRPFLCCCIPAGPPLTAFLIASFHSLTAQAMPLVSFAAVCCGNPAFVAD